MALKFTNWIRFLPFSPSIYQYLWGDKSLRAQPFQSAQYGTEAPRNSGDGRLPGWVDTEFFDRAETQEKKVITYFNAIYQPQDVVRTALRDMKRGKDGFHPWMENQTTSIFYKAFAASPGNVDLDEATKIPTKVSHRMFFASSRESGEKEEKLR